MNRRRFIKNTAGLLVPLCFPGIVKASPLFFGQNVAATGLPTGNLIANETFETPTTGFVLPGWNTQIGTGSTVNPVANIAPSPAGGAQYLNIIQAGDTGDAYKDFTASGEVSGWFLFRWVSGSGKVFALRDVGGTVVVFIQLSAGGLPTIYDGGNNASVDWGSTISPATWYYFYYHWKHGAGQTVQLAISTTNIRPAWVTQNGGNSSTDATRLFAGENGGSTFTRDYDNLNVGTTAL